jgi:membrane protein DedA with SNARE-associated domain
LSFLKTVYYNWKKTVFFWKRTMNEMIQFLIRHGYAVLFLWLLFEQLGLPIPAAPLLIAAGVLAGAGQLDLALALGVALIASLLSDHFWYYMGFHRGRKVLSLLCRISLDPDSCVRKTKEIFARHGARSLLVAKFIPGMTAVAPPLAGIFRMPWLRFLLFDGLGAFFWVGIFISVGYLFSHQIEHVAGDTGGMGPWIGLIVPGCLAVYIAWKYIQRQRFLRHLAIARITPEEVKQKFDAGEDLLILDMRDALEFEAEPYTLPGAVHLPVEKLDENYYKIPRNRDIVLYCN